MPLYKIALGGIQVKKPGRLSSARRTESLIDSSASRYDVVYQGADGFVARELNVQGFTNERALCPQEQLGHMYIASAANKFETL